MGSCKDQQEMRAGELSFIFATIYAVLPTLIPVSIHREDLSSTGGTG